MISNFFIQTFSFEFFNFTEKMLHYLGARDYDPELREWTSLDPMNKVYVLSHIHKFKKESSECLYGHTDIKLIGIFYSKTTSENVLEKYKKLEGFKDNIEDFYVSEYLIDSIYNTHLSELINCQVPKKDASELLYLLYFIEEFEDGHSDTKLLGVFSSQQKAENSVALIKCIPEMASIHDQFEICENKIDQLGWKEGFITLK